MSQWKDRSAEADLRIISHCTLSSDEPTEALDAPTERAVVERLTQRLARAGQCLIVVTHREAVAALCTVHVSPATCSAIGTGTPHRAVRVLAPVY